MSLTLVANLFVSNMFGSSPLLFVGEELADDESCEAPSEEIDEASDASCEHSLCRVVDIVDKLVPSESCWVPYMPKGSGCTACVSASGESVRVAENSSNWASEYSAVFGLVAE